MAPLEILRAITREKIPAARLIGNDSALCDAMMENLWDGVVSGVACVLPELMTSLFATEGKETRFEQSHRLLQAYIDQMALLPTPWGLKVTSAAREYTRESYPFPLSPAREQEKANLRKWFAGWYGQTTK